jgi:hypothetical protein
LDALISYLAVLLVYVPGLFLVLSGRRLLVFPIVGLLFLGQLVFNALGAFSVLQTRFSHGGVDLATNTYVWLLMLQAAIFYALAGPYLLFRKVAIRSLNISREDALTGFAILALAIAGAASLVIKHGLPPFFHLFSGELRADTVGAFRGLTHGAEEGLKYKMAFLIAPALAFCWLLLCFFEDRRRFYLVALIASLVFPLLLGEKVGVLQTAAAAGGTAIYWLARRARKPTVLVALRVAPWLLASLVPTAIFFLLYYEDTDSGISEVANRLWFRLFVAYSETFAGAVAMLRDYGPLDGSSLPTIWGLLPHERTQLEGAMIWFLDWGTVPQDIGDYIGAAPVLGFVVFAVGFTLILIGVQEMLVGRSSSALLGVLTAWFSVQALSLSFSSGFATFVSLTYSLVLVTMIGIHLSIKFLLSRKLFRTRGSWGVPTSQRP